MDEKYLVAIDEFCASHKIEISFISSLNDSGLIELKTIKESEFIEVEQLRKLEKFIRLYYELDINLEGIETINYLLQRIDEMNDEIRRLRNTLRLYES
jgi:hypothetical protein